VFAYDIRLSIGLWGNAREEKGYPHSWSAMDIHVMGFIVNRLCRFTRTHSLSLFLLKCCLFAAIIGRFIVRDVRES
jgi:hypothetical protein